MVRSNLNEQRRLFVLLGEFYESHEPVSFQAHLIIETMAVDLGAFCLRSQGASVRLILEDETVQRQWAEESMAEFKSFGEFLVRKHGKIAEQRTSG